jgi:cell division protein FtsN
MQDYKEPFPRAQKRHQFKRLLGIMGGMIFAFGIFILGVRVGIQVERERVHIAQQTTARTTGNKATGNKDKQATTSKGKEKKEPAQAPKKRPEKKEQKMRFTFYETLTEKEAAPKEPQKTKKTRKQEKQDKTTVKPEETKAPPSPSTETEETNQASAAKSLYFVQIASFREEETAEALKDRLAKKGYKVRVTPVQLEEMGLWYRVKLGGYKDLQEAHEAQRKISFEEGFTGTTVISEP